MHFEKQLSLIELIGDLNKDIYDNVHHITYGGCGIFSYNVSKFLSELKISHEICYTTSREDKILDNYKLFLSGKHDLIDRIDSIPSHVFIKLGGIYFDGYELQVHPRTLSNIKKVCNYPGIDFLKFTVDNCYWNEWFDRSQEPLVIDIIERNLSKLNITAVNSIKPKQNLWNLDSLVQLVTGKKW